MRLRATLGGKPMGTAVCVSPECVGEESRDDPLALRVEVSAPQIVELSLRWIEEHA